MEVPVPAAKQLLQGSSSPLNLSHLLLVLRHWSQAKEREISRDERGAGQAGRASAAPFPIGSLGWVLVIVGYVEIGKGRFCRHGEGMTRVGREGEEDRRTPSESRSSMGFCNWTLARHRRPLPGRRPICEHRLYSFHFFIFVFHSKGRNAQMPPYYRDTSTIFNIHRLSQPPQPCIVASVLWDASVAK